MSVPWWRPEFTWREFVAFLRSLFIGLAITGLISYLIYWSARPDPIQKQEIQDILNSRPDIEILDLRPWP